VVISIRAPGTVLLLLLVASPARAAWQRGVVVKGKVDGVPGVGKINVFLPAGYSADARPFRLLLALHGWRGRGSDWERNSPLAHYASRHRYVIVAPHMKTTVYERRYYPETSPRHRWGAIPGGRWLGEVVLPRVRARYNVRRDRGGTGVFGLSTGGRGAALLAQYYPKQFGGFAALSGDYDITLMPKDRTVTYIYGSFARFPERWRRDNSRTLLERLRGVPALLIHGRRDRVCPVAQTRLFARDMRRKGYDVTFIEDPNLGHGWKLWAGYLGAVFDFFDRKLKR
jgi:enterochelin esterase-like enzyme